MITFNVVFHLKSVNMQCLLRLAFIYAIWMLLCNGFVLKVPSTLKKVHHAVMSRIVIPTIAREYNQPGKVEVANGKFVVPGDYVTHNDYGIGRYLGTRTLPVHSMPKFRADSPTVDVIDIEYLDGIITWYVKFAQRDVWRFRTGVGANDQELSSIIDTSKWIQRQKVAMEDAEKMAMDLIYLNCLRNTLHRPPCIANNQQYEDFLNRFPYTPTVDQVACFTEVERDMCYSTRPMDRLIAGDVGFGKTEVAMRAIYRAVISSKQVAVLAPTVVLARQHERVMRLRMPDVNVQLLVGGEEAQSQQVKADVLSGKCQVLVATHALLEPNVKFHNLGLLVIDEEHRFGVDQKEVVKSVNAGIDILTLSATPLPRTLQITNQQLKEISQMNSAPQGRKAVETYLQPANDTSLVKRAIDYELARGGQIYMIVPHISHFMEMRNLLREVAPNVSTIEAHGRHQDLGERIARFARGEASILVSTTVVENGIDVPNANTILIFHADMFGMSALYQLRGRVGRSSRQAYCYYFTPDKKQTSTKSKQRLNYLMEHTSLGSGYQLALQDKKIRGSGSVFGKQQSGVNLLGDELQVHYMFQAHNKIRDELVLSVPHTELFLDSEVERQWMDRDKWTKLNNTLQAEIQMADTIIRSQWNISADGTGGSGVDEADGEKGSHFWSNATVKRDQMLAEYMMATSKDMLVGFHETWKGELSKTELPKSLSDLLYRTRLQTAAKAVGVSSVSGALFEDQDSEMTGSSGGGSYLRLQLRTSEINRNKWRDMFAPLITKEHQQVFDVFHEVIFEPPVALKAGAKKDDRKLDAVMIFLFKKNLKPGQRIRESHPDFVIFIEFLELMAGKVVDILQTKLETRAREKREEAAAIAEANAVANAAIEEGRSAAAKAASNMNSTSTSSGTAPSPNLVGLGSIKFDVSAFEDEDDDDDDDE